MTYQSVVSAYQDALQLEQGENNCNYYNPPKKSLPLIVHDVFPRIDRTLIICMVPFYSEF